MSACILCKAIVGQLSAELPHEQLSYIDEVKHKSMGLAVGKVEQYKCNECGSILGRDLDKKDDYANWFLEIEG